MWNIYGHEWAVALLQHSLATSHTAHAYLFTGPPHIGKTLLGVTLAQALNCAEPDAPCGKCLSCTKIARETHPDVRIIVPENGTLKIAQIREMQRDAHLAPYEGQWRVYILTDFQHATTEAANCLLKTLEEPPNQVVLVLTAVDPGSLLPTIISRCQSLSLRPLTIKATERALRSKGVEAAQAELLARLSEGAIGWALDAAQDASVLEQRADWLALFEQLPAQNLIQRLEQAQRLEKLAEHLPQFLDLWVVWWRDVLLMQADCQELVTNVDQMAKLDRQAAAFRPTQSHRFLQTMQQARSDLEHNANARLTLEVLLMDCPQPAQ